MTKTRQLWRLVRESHAEPLRGEPQVPVSPQGSATAVTFIGHSSFLIQTGGAGLLVDPVFATRLIVLRRQRRPGIRISDLPRIDAVLISHAHMDHLNRPSLRAITREMRRRGFPAPVAVVPHQVVDLVDRLGFGQVLSLRWWESLNLPNTPTRVAITHTPARHWGARLFNDTHRGFGGYAIHAAAQPIIYHSGDTAYFSGFHEIGRRVHPQIALLPIGAYYPDSYRAVHTSPEEALRAFLELGAESMVPMHYNTFRLGREPMTEPLPRLLAAAERAGVRDRIHPLAEGQTWLTSEPAKLLRPVARRIAG